MPGLGVHCCLGPQGSHTVPVPVWTGLFSPCCKLTPTFPRLGFIGEASLNGQFCRVGAPVVLRRQRDNSQTLEGQREAFMASSAVLFLPFPGRGSLSLLPRAAEAFTDSLPLSRAAWGVVEQTRDVLPAL